MLRLHFLGLLSCRDVFPLALSIQRGRNHVLLKPAARAMFRAVIDVGHTEKAFGATSARGLTEFSFNLNLAKRINQDLLAAGFKRSVLLISEGRSWPALGERIKRANAMRADLFLSIHHDSVPDKFLETWEFEGVRRGYSDRFSGHSIFISYDNSDLPGSLSRQNARPTVERPRIALHPALHAAHHGPSATAAGGSTSGRLPL